MRYENLNMSSNITYDALNVSDEYKPGIDLVCDLDSMPFKDKAFSKTICLDVLEYYNEITYWKIFEEVCRVTRGFLLLAVVAFDEVIKKCAEGLDLEIANRLLYGNHYEHKARLWTAISSQVLSFLEKRDFAILQQGIDCFGNFSITAWYKASTLDSKPGAKTREEAICLVRKAISQSDT